MRAVKNKSRKAKSAKIGPKRREEGANEQRKIYLEEDLFSRGFSLPKLPVT